MSRLVISAVFVASLLASAPAAGRHDFTLGIKLQKWSSRYSMKLIQLAASITSFEYGSGTELHTCENVSTEALRARRIPAPPMLRSTWHGVVRQYYRFAQGCLRNGGMSGLTRSTLSRRAEKKADRDFYHLFDAMVRHHIALGVTLGAMITPSFRKPSTSKTTTSFGSTSSTSPPAPPATALLALGTATPLTKNGKPYLVVTADRLSDPASRSTTATRVAAPGNVYVAIEFTFKNEGTTTFTTDIYNCTRIYDSSDQSFIPSSATTSAGRSFPTGLVALAPGRSATGWVMFVVPASPLAYVTFTPYEGLATNARTKWSLSG